MEDVIRHATPTELSLDIESEDCGQGHLAIPEVSSSLFHGTFNYLLNLTVGENAPNKNESIKKMFRNESQNKTDSVEDVWKTNESAQTILSTNQSIGKIPNSKMSITTDPSDSSLHKMKVKVDPEGTANTNLLKPFDIMLKYSEFDKHHFRETTSIKIRRTSEHTSVNDLMYYNEHINKNVKMIYTIKETNDTNDISLTKENAHSVFVTEILSGKNDTETISSDDIGTNGKNKFFRPKRFVTAITPVTTNRFNSNKNVLMYYLFKNYNKNIRPIVHAEDVTRVKLNIALLDILEMVWTL